MWPTLLAAMAVIVVACSGSTSSATPATSASAPSTAPASPATSSAASAAPASAAASAVSGEGLRIGYISGGDSDPFVLLVTNGIRAAAKAAGVELSECDSDFAAEKALACARNARRPTSSSSMINWQFYPGFGRRDLRGLREPPDGRHRHAGEAVPEDVRRREQSPGRAHRRQGPR